MPREPRQPARCPRPPRGRRALRRALSAGAVLLLGASLAGCAKPQGVLFQRSDGRITWPPPPDAARIRYVGELKSSEDLRAARGPLQQLGRAIFGAEPPAGTLTTPTDVATDGGDRVFVADRGARVVHVFDLESRRYAAWKPPKPADLLFQPTALAWDPVGRLLVTDPGIAAIYVFDARGRCLGTLGDGDLQRPVGLAVDRDSREILVADTGEHRLVVLSPDDVVLATIGERGTRPGQFNFPTFVATDADGRVYVSDSLNFRVQVLERDGSVVRTIGEKGDLPGYFSQPKGIGVDGEGRLFVVDANFEAVQIFDDAGALLMAFGEEGRGPGEFWLPVGLHIDERGWVWIADSYNHRVQVFELIAAEEASP